jgi:hypothetical protein
MLYPRYDLRPYSARVWIIPQTGPNIALSYVVWPNHSPARDHYVNKAAAVYLMAGMSLCGGMDQR